MILGFTKRFASSLRAFSFTALALACLITPFAYGEQVQVTSNIDKRTAQVGEEIHLSIRISGAMGNIQAPRLPAFKGFDTFYTGRASHISFINGQSSSNVEFSYVLVPKEAGTFSLLPIEVVVGGQSFAAPGGQIEVRPSQAPAGPKYTPSTPYQPPANMPPASSSQSPLGGASSASAAGAAPPDMPEPAPTFQPNDDNIFVRAFVDKTTVYPNEQISLTYSLYTRYDTRYEGFDKEPEVSGFWIEEFPMDRDVQRETVRYNNKRYVKADVKKMALFPTAPAEYTIEPGTMKASIRQEPESTSVFDDFFNDSFFSGGGFFARRENRILKPPPIQITVKPFPEQGKPASFVGAVGNFTMTAVIDKTTVKQNEPVSVKITIEGQGNIETLNKPKVPEMKGFKTYDADTSSQLFKTGNVIGGRKTFEIVFIPTDPGNTKIPKFDFSFFNPATASYVTQSTPEFNLTVTPSDQPFKLPKNIADQEAFKKDLEVQAKDIRYIHERLPGEKAESLFSFFYWAIIGGDVFGFIFLLVGFFRRREESIFAKDNALKRRKLARARAESRIRKLKAKSAHYYEDAEKILTQYLSDKFNLSAHGMTRGELETQLHSTLGPGDPLFQDILEFYQLCDESRFAHAEVSQEHKAKAIKILKESISRVERMRR